MPIVWRGSLDMGALGRRIGPGVARTRQGLDGVDEMRDGVDYREGTPR